MKVDRKLFWILFLALACTVDVVRANYRWVRASNGYIPPGAIMGGYDQKGLQPLYVGRTWHSGLLLPGKVSSSNRACYVSLDGREYASLSYDVLCDDKIWVKASDGFIPKGAIPSGLSKTGETLYIGRAYYKGLTLGKVEPSKGYLFVPYGRQELKFRDYEILIVNPAVSAAAIRGTSNMLTNGSAVPKPINETLEYPSALSTRMDLMALLKINNTST